MIELNADIARPRRVVALNGSARRLFLKPRCTNQRVSAKYSIFFCWCLPTTSGSEASSGATIRYLLGICEYLPSEGSVRNEFLFSTILQDEASHRAANWIDGCQSTKHNLKFLISMVEGNQRQAWPGRISITESYALCTPWTSDCDFNPCDSHAPYGAPLSPI